MDADYLRETFESADVLHTLEPEELGAILIEAIRRDRNAMANVGQAFNAFFPGGANPVAGFERVHMHGVQQALYEAWAWLEAQGFLIWSDEANGRNGYRVPSRRAANVHPGNYPRFAAARSIPHGIVHERIRTEVWGDFVRGRYGSAVFHASREVEIAVRDAAGFGNDVRGVDLMRRAFEPSRGPLTDMNAEAAEREARAHLFAGFYGAYRNPVAHRDIDVDDPAEALELVLMASHLLRIVDARANALGI